MTVGGLKKPQYIGENRCWPCTIVNLLVLATLCGLLAVVSIPAAAAVGLVGVGAVLWRGYLVPYTPRFAPRLAARLPWNPFHAPDDEPESIAPPTDGVDGEEVLAALTDAGVLTVEGDELRVAEGYWARWDREMGALRELDDDALADAALDVAPGARSVETVREGSRRYAVLSDGTDDPAGERWVRRPNAIAETAAARALVDAGVREELRAVAAGTLKMFLEECPACGAELSERAAGGCCGAPLTTPDGQVKRGLVCEACDVHLHVFD